MSVDENDLMECLLNLRNSELALSEFITNTGTRFSTNKLTGDLGEFYVKLVATKYPDLFVSIFQPVKSNELFDLEGVINKNSILFEIFRKERLLIEVKTRRNQSGIKYLSNVKPAQFDLLCMVDIASDYSLQNIFFIDSDTVEKNIDKKYGRLIFKEAMAFFKL